MLRFQPQIRILSQIFSLLAVVDLDSEPVKTGIVTLLTFFMQTTDGRDVTCTVTKEGDSKWVITQKNKKAGGPDVKVRY